MCWIDLGMDNPSQCRLWSFGNTAKMSERPFTSFVLVLDDTLDEALGLVLIKFCDSKSNFSLYVLTTHDHG